MNEELKEYLERMKVSVERLEEAEKTVTEVAEKLKKHDTNPLAHQNLSWRKTIERNDDRLAEFQLALAEFSTNMAKNMSRISEVEKEIIELKGEIQLMKNNMG